MFSLLSFPFSVCASETGWGAGSQVSQHHPHHAGCQQPGGTPGLSGHRSWPGHQVSAAFLFTLHPVISFPSFAAIFLYVQLFSTCEVFPHWQTKVINSVKLMLLNFPSLSQHAALLFPSHHCQTLHKEEGEHGDCQLPESCYEGAAEQVTNKDHVEI